MMDDGKAPTSVGPFLASGCVTCTCGRVLVSLGSGTAFTCQQHDRSPDPPDFGLVLTCECGTSWSLVDERDSGQRHPIRKLRLFVFDDELLILDFLGSLLESRGYEVLSFKGPLLCKECNAPQGQPCADIILSDVRMPGVTGIEFAQHQKEVGCRCRHFALMSGAWSPQDVDAATDAGCKIFQKPFSMTELAPWLDECETSVDLSVPLYDGYRTQNAPHG